MKKVVELDKVLLEYPNDILEDEEELTEEEEMTLVETRTTRLSKEELLRRLEETTTLHL